MKTSLRLEDAAAAQLVIEAVTEDLPLKLDLFGRLDRICPPPAVLGSSSGQPASALIAKVANPERVIATHFWYPPQLIPLVEVCAGPKTAPEVTRWVCEVLKQAGKEPAVIDKEIPGFIGNRLQFAMLREAWALWASGAASAEAIDTVVRNSFGRRVGITGPIELADAGGLYTMYHFGKSLMPASRYQSRTRRRDRRTGGQGRQRHCQWPGCLRLVEARWGRTHCGAHGRTVSLAEGGQGPGELTRCKLAAGF